MAGINTTAPRGAGLFPPTHQADGLKTFLSELAVRPDVPKGVRVRAALLRNINFAPSERFRLSSEAAAYIDASTKVLGTSLWQASRDAATWTSIGAIRLCCAYLLVKGAARLVAGARRHD